MFRDAPVTAVLPAKDLKRAIEFYRDKLGLRMMDTDSADGVKFQCGGGTTIYVYQRPGGTKAEHTAAAWLVDDVEQTVKELRAKGVDFEQYDLPGIKTDQWGIADMDGTRSAWFKDPEGNILAITDMSE